MLKDISIKNMLNAIVPISRFNKGEANKIFEEVNENGFKIVVKNNKPTCILLTPEKYEEMVETIEDFYLLQEAKSRYEHKNLEERIGHDDILTKINISSEELDEIDVELE